MTLWEEYVVGYSSSAVFAKYEEMFEISPELVRSVRGTESVLALSFHVELSVCS